MVRTDDFLTGLLRDSVSFVWDVWVSATAVLALLGRCSANPVMTKTHKARRQFGTDSDNIGREYRLLGPGKSGFMGLVPG